MAPRYYAYMTQNGRGMDLTKQDYETIVAPLFDLVRDFRKTARKFDSAARRAKAANPDLEASARNVLADIRNAIRKTEDLYINLSFNTEGGENRFAKLMDDLVESKEILEDAVKTFNDPDW